MSNKPQTSVDIPAEITAAWEHGWILELDVRADSAKPVRVRASGIEFTIRLPYTEGDGPPSGHSPHLCLEWYPELGMRALIDGKHAPITAVWSNNENRGGES